MRLALSEAVRRAYEESRGGSLPQRAWRELTGGSLRHDEPAAATVDRAAIDRFVARIGRTVAREAVDASVEMTVSEVHLTPLAEGPPARRRRQARRRGGEDARRPPRPAPDGREGRGVAPAVTTKQVWEEQPTAVTVSLSERVVRVFDKGELTTSYNVAVGEPRYPTPPGRFTVQGMQVDPPWNVPQSDWAGDLAGTTIPGGDPSNPLVARWIGFNGSVGFHGTASIGSIGTRGVARLRPHAARRRDRPLRARRRRHARARRLTPAVAAIRKACRSRS